MSTSLGIAIGGGKKLVDEFLKRWHHRQAIGPALVVTIVDELARAERSVLGQKLARNDSHLLPAAASRAASSNPRIDSTCGSACRAWSRTWSWFRLLMGCLIVTYW